jgi:osmotically inducible lipoprotein OsmB
MYVNRQTGYLHQLTLKTHDYERGGAMNTLKTTQRFGLALVCTVVLLSVSACAGMTEQEKDTAIGAGVGAVGGSVLTGGSALGTLGGAAAGGVVGHELSKPKK